MLSKYVQLVDTQAKMKLKAQSNKLILNYIWWLLEPILFVTMFYFVFKILLMRAGDDYLSFLIIGKVIFLWFSKSIISASNSLIQNKGIIAQRPIPKWVFPLINIHEASYKSMFSILVLLPVLFFNGYYPHVGYWQLIPLLIVTYILICGLGFLCAILVAIANDFSNIIHLVMTGLMFCSGIFWDISSISSEESRHLILLFNPVAAIVDSFRNIFLTNTTIDFFMLIPSLIIGGGAILFGLFIFKTYDGKITRLIFS